MKSAIRKVSYYYQTGPFQTCDRCSTAIRHVFVVHYVDGLTEKYGSECINKILSGDTSLKALFNKNAKLLQKYQNSLAALSMPADQMPRGKEYFGSGIYFIADCEGKDVFSTHWFFHPVFDQEKNAAGRHYIVEDAAARMKKCCQEIEEGKAWFAKEIGRLETFLGRVIQKGLLT